MANQSSRDRAFLKKLREIVEENFADEKFGVEDLAHEVGLSRSQIHRKLHELTNQSTSQFIREIRLEHAREMLQNNVATISEIAYRVGFSSPTYFSKCFHEYYGFPPGEAVHAEPDEEDKHPSDSEPSKSNSTAKYRNLLYATIVLVLLVLLGGGYYYYQNGWETEAKAEESIAVLPLDNLTGDPEQAFFVDGLHDALIGELGQLSRLRVISRTSTLQFRDTESAIREIADRLGVNNIIEGSVYRAEDSVRIQLQLIQIDPEEQHLWAQNYDRGTGNILSLLSDVTREIAQNVQITLTPVEDSLLADRREVNPETYKAYLRGMYHLNQSTPENFQKGMNYLHEAVEKDPADPMAYAGLAQGYINLGHGSTPSSDAFQKARSAALRAIKLDSTIAEAYSALGSYKLYFEHDWEGAERAFKRANELNPNLPWNHYHYAWYLDLFDREEEAISEHKMAHELDPLNPYINGWLAWLYAKYGYYEFAEQEVENTLMLDKNHPIGLIAQGLLYTQKRKYDEAIIAFKKATAVNPSWQWLLGHAYSVVGEVDETREILSKIEQKDLSSYNAFERAAMYTALGELDKAFQWISYEPPHAYVPWISRNSSFDSLRTDSRYDEFLARFDLPRLD